jgi:2-oxoglutarate dehydrogenase E2 component (dihydrolipoamide succinyltransferase)
MHQSLLETAQLTTVMEVDLTAVARLRDSSKAGFREREGISLTFLPFVALAAVEALQVFPQVNASLNPDGDTVTYPGAEHLGIAVDTLRGLLVPVIHDAGNLSVSQFSRKIADVAQRSRDGSITVDEMSGGTFTITNTGSLGALFDTPIVNYRQSAILGVGAIVERPAVVERQGGERSIAIRSMMYLALSYDHRILDGADAARYLGWVKNRLEAADFEEFA